MDEEGVMTRPSKYIKKYPPELITEARAMFTFEPGQNMKEAADKLGVSVQRLHQWVRDIRDAAGVIKHYRSTNVAAEKVERCCNLCRRQFTASRYVYNCGCNRNISTGVMI